MRLLANAPAIPVLVLSAALTGPLAFGVVTALSDSSQSEPHRGGPVTDRTLVAVGSGAELGDFRLLRSETAAGEECLAIERTATEDPYAEGPVKVRQEECGGVTSELGTITGRREVIVFGRIPADTTSVALRADGRAPQALRRVTPKGGDSQYVLAVVKGGPLRNPHAELRRQTGGSVALDVAVPSAATE